MKKTRFFSSFDEDFTVNSGQNYKIPEDYEYLRENKAAANFLYYFLFLWGVVYLKFFLHVKIVGKKKIKKKEKYFLFGNHTQPLGDVFLPSLIAFPKRFYAIVSPSNLGLPVIGRLLPIIGAIPLPPSLKKMSEFTSAISRRFDEGYPIVIYPEGHVWEYMKDIRPFSDASFQFPIKENAPVYTFTSTYQKRKFGKKPKMTVFIDGPFYPDASLGIRQRRAGLYEKVFNAMEKRSRLSNVEYIAYRRAEEN